MRVVVGGFVGCTELMVDALHLEGVDEAGYRHEVVGTCGVCTRLSFRGLLFLDIECLFVEAQTVAVGKVEVRDVIAIGGLLQFDGDVARLVLLLSLGHILGMGDVLVIRNTAILVHLHEVTVVDSLHLIALADVGGKESGVEEGGGLVGVRTAAVEVVDVETKSHPLVGVDGEVGLEALFTRQFVTRLIVSQVGVGHVAVGEVEFFWPYQVAVKRVDKEVVPFVPTLK